MNNIIAHAPQTEVAPGVFQGRWGFYPCSWATYQLLRQLNRQWLKAERQVYAWRRWRAKAPHNRLQYRHVRDAQGNKVSSEVVGPLPEPALDGRFIQTRNERVYHDAGVYYSAGHLAPRPQLDGAIRCAYLQARYPRTTPAEVKPLPYTPAQLQALLAV